ncbi:Hypothetical protein PP7435_CHR1-0005 [Komagataella phaffii CBS 7435]|uniref:Uncharacterized protein n=1 Tax=Komagataella phaffii (strain ATCC 76273 / CBS 7435 / CECT 11047 / NRRL Y-11430 / Wegner 21-1) TaxID=981350 RepID=F2QL99_KOMPC|nr:Hypothetical protein BQ9382_C1-0025 [Komagataella phaffii CBS 7435]CCA36177.1 Hypothetical protein PP7435_CHR1-0005 [Komagataella phaffii CBS 7435]
MSLNGYVTQEDGTRFDQWFKLQTGNTYLRVDKSPQNPDTHLLFEERDAETEAVVSSFEIKLNIPPEEWFKIPFSCPRDN